MSHQITEDSVLVVGGRKRGRPPVDDPLTPLTVRVPTAYYDRIHRMATDRRVSISMLVRSLLKIELNRGG